MQRLQAYKYELRPEGRQGRRFALSRPETDKLDHANNRIFLPELFARTILMYLDFEQEVTMQRVLLTL